MKIKIYLETGLTEYLWKFNYLETGLIMKNTTPLRIEIKDDHTNLILSDIAPLYHVMSLTLS